METDIDRQIIADSLHVTAGFARSLARHTIHTEEPVAPYFRTHGPLLVRQVTTLLDELTRMQGHAVTVARAEGASWRDIGDAAGISHEAARQRWSDAELPALEFPSREWRQP